jgi:hypothetical protein
MNGDGLTKPIIHRAGVLLINVVVYILNVNAKLAIPFCLLHIIYKFSDNVICILIGVVVECCQQRSDCRL